MKRRIKFECTKCGDTGDNVSQPHEPEGAVKMMLDRCASCRMGGEPNPVITFLDKEGKELK